MITNSYVLIYKGLCDEPNYESVYDRELSFRDYFKKLLLMEEYNDRIKYGI